MNSPGVINGFVLDVIVTVFSEMLVSFHHCMHMSSMLCIVWKPVTIGNRNEHFDKKIIGHLWDMFRDVINAGLL